MSDKGVRFGAAIRRVRDALGLSQDTFGARLGVSRRTLTRWECHDELPPVGQRKHIATSFPDAPADLVEALVRSLELGDKFVVSLSSSRPAPPTVAAVVDGAFLELCERVDVAPGRLRGGLVEFLRRVEAAAVPLDVARAQLQPKTTRRA